MVTAERSVAWLSWALATASTVIGVALGFLLYEAREWRRHRTERRSVARVLAAEIKAARDRYQRAVGRQIEAEREGSVPDMSGWRAERYYFPAYEANCGHLGELPQKTMEKVVAFIEGQPVTSKP
jgi:hypothetical protein